MITMISERHNIKLEQYFSNQMGSPDRVQEAAVLETKHNSSKEPNFISNATIKQLDVLPNSARLFLLFVYSKYFTLSHLELLYKHFYRFNGDKMDLGRFKSLVYFQLSNAKSQLVNCDSYTVQDVIIMLGISQSQYYSRYQPVVEKVIEEIEVLARQIQYCFTKP